MGSPLEGKDVQYECFYVKDKLCFITYRKLDNSLAKIGIDLIMESVMEMNYFFYSKAK